MIITAEIRRAKHAAFVKMLSKAAAMTALALLLSNTTGSAQEVKIIGTRVDQAVNESKRLYSLGQFDDAIGAAQLALRMQPNSALAYNNMAVSYAGLGKWDQAIESVRIALRLQPGFQLAVNNLAWFLHEKATPISISQMTSAAADWLDLSLGLYQTQRYPEAVDAARAALKLQPDMAEAYNNIGAAYAEMGMWDEAMQAATEALRLRPDFQLARNNLAWAQSEKQKPIGTLR